MTDFRFEIDEEYERRVAEKRASDAATAAANDKQERWFKTIIAGIVIVGILVIFGLLSWVSDRAKDRHETGSLTIVIPVPTPTASPEVEEEPVSAWGTQPFVTEAMIRSTEPRDRPVMKGLRTVPISFQTSTPGKASAKSCLQDCQRTLRRLPLGGSAGAHPSSTEGGVGSLDDAAWKDTQGLVRRRPSPNRSPWRVAGVEPGRHLQTPQKRKAGFAGTHPAANVSAGATGWRDSLSSDIMEGSDPIAYPSRVSSSHGSLEVHPAVANRNRSETQGIRSRRSGYRVSALDEGLGQGISVLHILPGHRQEGGAKDASDGSSTLSRSLSRAHGIGAAQVRPIGMRERRAPLRREQLRQHEGSRREDVAPRIGSRSNGKAEGKGRNRHSRQSPDGEGVGGSSRSVREHHPKSQAAEYLEGRWSVFLVTAYSFGCTNPRSGKEPKVPQRQSNRKWPEANWTVAAPPEIPYDAVLELSYRGILTTRIVGDRGPDIVMEPGKLPRLDLFMENCDRARTWGVRRVMVREIRRPLGVSK